MRGIISGGFWGLMVGGVGVATASLVNEQPAGNAPPAMPQLIAPETAQADVAVLDGMTGMETAGERAYDTEAPLVVSPPTEVSAPEADTDPSPLPETTDVNAVLSVPTDVAVPEVSAGLDEPVLPNDHAVAPEVPSFEEELLITTQPSKPETVEIVSDEPVVSNEVAAAPTAPAVQEEASEQLEFVAPQQEAEQPAEEVTVQIDEPAQDLSVQADVIAVPAESVAVADELATEPLQESENAESTPAPEIEELANNVDLGTPLFMLPDAASPEEQPEIATLAPYGEVGLTEAPAEVSEVPAEEAEAPAEESEVLIVEEPVAPSEDTFETDTASESTDVRVNRITQPEVPAEEEAEAAEVEELPEDAPALLRYAAPFESIDGTSLISVLLIDDSASIDAVAAVSALSFPVTVILDPSIADATEKMIAYRNAGIEIGLQTSLPDGATPTDLEVAFEGAFATLPEAVVLLDLGDSGLLADRALTAQAMYVLASEGRGLVAVERGLGGVLRIAQQAEVPAKGIFRDLDGEGQDARSIERTLDRAAFRARQESGVVVIARLSTGTINVLTDWTVDNQRGQVVMAPVSALLQPTETE